MRILQRFSLALSFALLLVLPEISSGAIAVPIVTATPGATLLRIYLYNHIVIQALAAFWGVSFAFIAYYAVKMILDAHKDEAYTDMSNAIIYALVGFAVIGCALAFATILTTGGLSVSTTSQIQPALAENSIDSVRQFIITLASGVFVLLVVISALRMVSTRGEQGDFDKWRKVLVGSCIGVMIMFIADFIVQAVDGRNALLIVEELRGIALFVLTFAGFLCVLAIIVAGIFLIISIDEGLRDRAKKTIIGTLIALVIVICCYAIILTFVPGGTSNTLISP